MFEFFTQWLQIICFNWIRKYWMMMTSGTSTGKKDFVCESRETALVNGHAVRGVQFKSNMDLGSGDTSDYYSDIQNSYGSFDWNSRLESQSQDFQTTQSTITKTHISESTSTPPAGKLLSFSSESINKCSSAEKLDEEKSNVGNLFKGKQNQLEDSKNATLTMVEDSKEPNFIANESNPTVPAPTETSKTSTLRLSDRTRSESEDDIEKMDESEQDGALIGLKTSYKTSATTENTPNSEKMDKNGNRSDSDQNETESDCVVQCLYYTMQCCECVIF